MPREARAFTPLEHITPDEQPPDNFDKYIDEYEAKQPTVPSNTKDGEKVGRIDFGDLFPENNNPDKRMTALNPETTEKVLQRIKEAPERNRRKQVREKLIEKMKVSQQKAGIRKLINEPIIQKDIVTEPVIYSEPEKKKTTWFKKLTSFFSNSSEPTPAYPRSSSLFATGFFSLDIISATILT